MGVRLTCFFYSVASLWAAKMHLSVLTTIRSVLQLVLSFLSIIYRFGNLKENLQTFCMLYSSDLWCKDCVLSFIFIPTLSPIIALVLGFQTAMLNPSKTASEMH